jgi:hypothetical protein
MLVLQTISQKAQEAGLPFLIIGGYAVMAHGFVRATDDLDLLVQRSKRDVWRCLLEAQGMSVYREATAFLQFNPAPGARLPVDLMFVADDVFEKLRKNAEQTRMGAASFGVVSLLHLIGLKCHAIEHGKEIRRLKDTEDLIQLIRINGLDLREPNLRASILKHGNQELYDKLCRACAAAD